MIRFAVLISGRGSNMTYLADAIKDYSIAAKITVVISNRCCDGITLAQNRGLPTKIIKRKNFKIRPSMRLPSPQPFIITGLNIYFLLDIWPF